MSAKTEYYLVYGGGKFGFNAVEKLKSEKKAILLVDHDPKCFIATHYQLKSMRKDEIFISLRNSASAYSENSSADLFFLLGDIADILDLVRRSPPKYLIPSAPIHVMKDLVVTFLTAQFPLIKVRSLAPSIVLSDKPVEMHHFSFDKPESYFSYAGWEEICPDNCIGPEHYCPYHKKKKPITVNSYLKKALNHEFHLGFDSIQLGAGLGGILGIAIQDHFQKLTEYVKEKINNQSFNLYISTSCNCHGVVSRLEINLS